ncbi:MAG: hypothetical protein M1826_002490 [Phylliscum demangeonii]|nr:MAG: hypothetical protein M1826_002490 [Phylliscum demangeonii]
MAHPYIEYSLLVSIVTPALHQRPMSSERIYIGCCWSEIPGKDTQRWFRLAADFASQVLHRPLSLFEGDYPHLPGAGMRKLRFIALDLHCHRTEEMATVDDIPYQCFKATYDGDHVTFVKAGFHGIQHYGRLIPWGDPRWRRSPSMAAAEEAFRPADPDHDHDHDGDGHERKALGSLDPSSSTTPRSIDEKTMRTAG